MGQKTTSQLERKYSSLGRNSTIPRIGLQGTIFPFLAKGKSSSHWAKAFPDWSLKASCIQMPAGCHGE